MGTAGASGADDLAVLYAAAYGRLVGLVTVVCGDAAEAEECVQDAFVRLIGRWDQVSRYDDPEAWLRKVALGMASNKRRKARNALSARRRQGVPPDQQPVSPELLDVARALAALPLHQRQVLVLQHYVGLEVEDIARQLGVPVGTVKSRLARGRAALAPQLRDEEARHA
ncbi:MAG: sigma-70 family RNA polymerase sigma factor [Actinobacteria bacterium]|nr:sigma-70 family RNA polymerase sigma factor [Actinomycetota bacterium]